MENFLQGDEMRIDQTVLKYIGCNRAVEKLAEEARGKLATEEPLQPDTKRDGRGNEYVGGAFRSPLSNFTPEFLSYHERSIEEIWTVHQKNTGALNYGNLLACFESRGGKSYQDAVAEYSDMENRYNLWYARCKLKPRDACLNVFGRGMNFKWAAMSMDTDRGCIKTLCEIGLQTYQQVSHGR